MQPLYKKLLKEGSGYKIYFRCPDIRDKNFEVLHTEHGRTPSERVSQENRALRDQQTFTPHDPPVLHATSGREVCSGPSMSMSGSQPYLYKRLPIGEMLQQGTYPDSPPGGGYDGPY